MISSTGCVIRKEKTVKIVTKGIKIGGKLYYIKDTKERKYLLAQKVEIVPTITMKTSHPKGSKDKKSNDDEEEEEEHSSKVPTKYVQKHHSKNQIIGDKTKGV